MRSPRAGNAEELVYALPSNVRNGAGQQRRACDRDALRFTLDRAGNVMSWAGSGGLAEARPDGRSLADVVADFGACSCDIATMLAEAKDVGWAERECWTTRTDASRLWCSILITSFGTDGCAPQGYTVVLRDLSERKRRETELRRLAETDPLTGILNRRSFLSLASTAVQRPRAEASSIAFAMLDLDRFKRINDRHGHAVGDIALTRFVGCMSRNLRQSDLLGRLGGDEFGLLLTGMTREDAYMLLQRLQQIVLAEEVVIRGQRLDLSFSFGFAKAQPGEPIERLVARADRVLMASKKLGRCRIRLTF